MVNIKVKPIRGSFSRRLHIDFLHLEIFDGYLLFGYVA